jgi:hypothetical protein
MQMCTRPRPCKVRLQSDDCAVQRLAGCTTVQCPAVCTIRAGVLVAASTEKAYTPLHVTASTAAGMCSCCAHHGARIASNAHWKLNVTHQTVLGAALARRHVRTKLADVALAVLVQLRIHLIVLCSLQGLHDEQGDGWLLCIECAMLDDASDHRGARRHCVGFQRLRRLHAHILLGAKDLGMARLAQLITVFPAVQGSGMKRRLVSRFHIVCLTSSAGDC